MKNGRGRQGRESKKFMGDRRGFSLVELIIAIAVIGIMAGSSIGLMSHIRYANTRKAAKQICATLSKLQTTSMSKAERRTLYIYKADGQYYMRVLTDAQAAAGLSGQLTASAGTKIGNGSVSITGKMGAVEKDPTGNEDDTCIKISYQRSGVYDYGSSRTNVDKIMITGNASYTITLLKSTGKYLLD